MLKNFQKAIHESLLDGLIIKPVGFENSTIHGRIEKCDQNHIYIKIVNGFEDISTTHRNPEQFYDVSFHINQTAYQLQLQALDYLKEHHLFDVIINNPSYQQKIDVNEYSLHDYNCSYKLW